MTPKIAIVIERADTALGGAERSVFELAAALSARGLHADILAAKGQAKAKNIHILCADTPGKRTSYAVFENALRKHLSQNHYDLIHSVLPFDFADVYQPRGGTYAESILRNAASYQNKVVEYYKKLTTFANIRRTRLLHAERKLCSGPTGPVIAALSEYVADQLKRHYGADPKRIVVIPNGVKNDKRIDPKEADLLRTQILTKLRLKEADNPVLFLFAANNFRLKGLTPLIRAISAAAAQPTERKPFLVVAGHDRPHRYRRIAESLGIRDRVLFLGPLRHANSILSVIDVAVLPTFYDPSSRYILEALAAGRPVITTKFNGAADLFADNRHGRIIDTPQDIPALAQAILHFTDTNNIERASHAIIEDNLKEKVSVTRVADRLISLYESILQSKGKK
jgi:UDP-glucose:(heptosyl)LPS alpha-1,3-glucosyltransferase